MRKSCAEQYCGPLPRERELVRKHRPLRKATYLILALGLLGGLMAAWASKTRPGSSRLRTNECAAHGPARPTGMDIAPPEVREFLGRMLAELPEAGVGVTGYQF